MKERIRAVRMAVLILAVLNLLVLDIGQVRQIHSNPEEGYWRQHGLEEKREIQNETLRTPFEAVSDTLTCLQLWGPQVQAPEGALGIYCARSSRRSFKVFGMTEISVPSLMFPRSLSRRPRPMCWLCSFN